MEACFTKYLSDSVLRNHLIQQVADTLSYYQLNGINVDFEELEETTNEPLTSFQKKLYETLHAEEHAGNHGCGTEE